MDITLRKANAIQIAITEALKGLKLDVHVTVSIYEPDVAASIAMARDIWENQSMARNQLFDALYEIRRKVGAANDAAGIDRILAELARLEKDAQFNAALTAVTPQESREVLQGRIQRLKTRDESPAPRYGAAQGVQETVTVSLFAADEIEDFKSELRQIKRRKQALQDELLELNARTTITLSAETVSLLKAQDLL